MPAESLVARAAAMLRSWLPQGRAVVNTPLAFQMLLLDGVAVEIARAQERLDSFQDETIPNRWTEMISEWEALLGLPDPTLPAPTTIEERRALVAGKLLDSFGHTELDIRAIARALGYDPIDFEHYEPAECGVAECGYSAMTNDYFSHVVVIHLYHGALDEAVQAAIQRVRRAHADFWFVFEAAPEPLIFEDEFVLFDGELVLV